ncbi:MAG TPA: transglutaminase family protein, partial [Candidatus Caenarcaniphilales bacterium]
MVVFSQDHSEPLPLSQPQQLWQAIRPIGVYQLYGLVFAKQQTLALLETSFRGNQETPDRLVALDTVRGYLLQINPENDNTTVLNPYQVSEFLDATGLALDEHTTPTTLWFCCANQVYSCQWPDLIPQLFARLPYPANGVAVSDSTVYITCQKAGYILLFDRTTRRQVGKLPAPGVGIENITLRGNELWVCDRTEQSVYCLDCRTGEIRFSLLTPFENPTALAFAPQSQASDTLYVAYAGEEPYIRDNPNSLNNPLELAIRDRTLIHSLNFRVFEAERYALSNGYLIEVSYVEEVSPLVAVHLENLEWRIALPADTARQTLKHVEPIGLPFTEEVQQNQRVAVFHFSTLKPGEVRLFGWKAHVEVHGIKYLLTPTDVEDIPALSPEFQARYLVDDDDLAMDTPIVQRAAREAIGTETNILRKILKIRNYVYEQLSYGIRPRIDTPDVVLDRGVGSCGEYVGVLLALARLNGIACRTVGRYKCPAHADYQRVP